MIRGEAFACFGNGTIALDIVKTDGGYKYALIMKETPQQEIGSKVLADDKPEEFPIKLLFKNIEGLDVLIHNLEKIREFLEGDE